MSVERSAWDSVGGRPVHRFVLTSDRGASLTVSDFGATLVSMVMPAPSGELADVVLGFDRAADYLATPTYFGATVGRFGNRIRRGKFVLDGQPHQVTCNEGPNSLHGGINGYDKRIWAAEVLEAENAVRFSLVSPDGDEGFPGELRMTSTYSLQGRTVRIAMEATASRLTLCNLVHHSYFNLAGHGSGTVLDQHLQIHADFYTPVDDELIISGEVLKVAGTAFDYRAMRALGDRIDEVPNGGFGRLEGAGVGGYDHNWCLKGEPDALRPVLKACDPVSGRGFTLHANQPGVHFYTGGYLGPDIIGKGGIPYCKFAGFTLETQKFPDGPNLSHVPQSRLYPDENYRHIMEFHFNS
jgi:aldose 1-epimerase